MTDKYWNFAMSALAGLYNKDGRPATDDQLEAMIRPLEYRGPDGIGRIVQGAVGLVYFMRFDTLESRKEELPAVSRCKRFLITLDGRIDNRDELYASTGMNRNRRRAEVTDSELVVAAYRKWQQECVKHLTGEFAFVIWDEERQHLFCARDCFGVRPFYYYNSGNTFYFATEIKGLPPEARSSHHISDYRILDYLIIGVVDQQTTFFKTIKRLKPAHTMTVSSTKSTFSCYWQLKQRRLYGKKDRDYEDEFAFLFRNAVKRRIRSDYPVGAFLSGGIDSSSIVAMLGQKECEKKHPFRTYSGVFDRLVECDERVYFHHLLKRYPKLVSCEITADELDHIAADLEIGRVEDEPYMAPHFFMQWHLLHQVAQDGVRIILDGHGGDSMMSHGYGVLADYALSGSLFRLVKEVYIQASGRLTRTFKNTARTIRDAYRWKYYRSGMDKERVLDPYCKEILSFLNKKVLTQEYMDRITTFYAEMPRSGVTEKEYHCHAALNSFHSWVLEFLERQYAQRNLSIALPFFDRDLLEFSYSLPPRNKRRDGVDRYTMRKALSDFIPPEVSWRNAKTIFDSSLFSAYLKNDAFWLGKEIDKSHEHIYTYIDSSKLCAVLGGVRNSRTPHTLNQLIFLQKAVSLSRWLWRLLSERDGCEQRMRLP